MLSVMSGMDEFGALVKSARDARGLTQEELARRLGRPHSFVVRIERGRNSNPPEPVMMDALQDALGLSRTAMLRALGYLPESDDVEEPTLSIPRDDPRARLLEVVSAMDDATVERATNVIEAVFGDLDHNRRFRDSKKRSGGVASSREHDISTGSA